VTRALLVVDIQNDSFAGGAHPLAFLAALGSAYAHVASAEELAQA